MNTVRKEAVASRFFDEELAPHWKVNATRKSFEALLHHLEVKTNTKAYFEEAVKRLDLDNATVEEFVVADIGSGVSWTSAILAKHPKVKFVYAVDPSRKRLEYADFVIRHFGVREKVETVFGTFTEPNIPEKVDLIILCGSLHHCYDNDLEESFSSIKKLVKPNGRILITDEHYVDSLWVLRRILGYLKRLGKTAGLGYSLKTLRAPEPFSGDHWRTKKELQRIFKENGCECQFFDHKGILNKAKTPFYCKWGWHFYYAILTPEK